MIEKEPPETDLRETIFDEKPDPRDFQFLVEHGYDPEALKNQDPKAIRALVEKIRAQG